MSSQIEQLQTQVSDLMTYLNSLNSGGPYSDELSNLLDQAVFAIQTLQDDLSSDDEAAIIAGLKAHNQLLVDLNKAMDAYSKKLDDEAKKIRGIANTVATVTGVVSGIVTAGIL